MRVYAAVRTAASHTRNVFYGAELITSFTYAVSNGQLEDRYVAMNRLPPDAFNPRAALRELPPLVRGYLRLGAYVGDGAVIDRDFGTIDVCIVVKTDLVTERYHRHYTREESARRRGAG